MNKKDKFHISELRESFGSGQTKFITLNDINSFYKQYEPNLNRNTLKWRVHYLITSGVLIKKGKGKYLIGKTILFKPDISKRIKSLYKVLKTEFPYATFCIWDTIWLNEFMVHQPTKYNIIVEAEKDTARSMFNYLISSQSNVYYKPDNAIIDSYIIGKKDNIVIIDLITEAPIKEIEGISIPTLEKILVDLISEKELFIPFQGTEITNIYSEALLKYSINFDKLIRYSRRRNKENEVKSLLDQITNFRQN